MIPGVHNDSTSGRKRLTNWREVGSLGPSSPVIARHRPYDCRPVLEKTQKEVGDMMARGPNTPPQLAAVANSRLPSGLQTTWF